MQRDVMMRNEPKSPRLHTSSDHGAAIALLVGTVFWGSGFTWAKIGGATINRLCGLEDSRGAAVGPILLLAVRFIAAGVLWMVFFPSARRAWSMKSVSRALWIGLLVGAGLIVQHIGLDQTSQAVSAFLTSLTIVFVPLLQTVAMRHAPRANVWLAVVVATVGVWLMTSAPGTTWSFGMGEALGLACAFVFSVYVLVVNALVPRDDPYRMTGGQFLVAGMLALCVLPFVESGRQVMSPHEFVRVFSPRDVWLNCALLVALPTLVSYGLLTIYQPRLDATRAALIYLMEPIFASVYAWVFAGSAMTQRQMLGAGMILIANAIAEVLDAWSRKRGAQVERAPREPV